MKEKICAICREVSGYKLLYNQNFKIEAINQNTFSARRMPDRSHYRVVRCKKCGMVFSTPILDSKEIETLYRTSDFTYGTVTRDLKHTYGSYLKKAEKYIREKNRLLEIGCGNGFFLETAKELGFNEVKGVEPSLEAVRQASPELAPGILNRIFGPDLYPASYFNVICFFQTLDHIEDPNKFLEYCRDYLNDKGIVLCITHNIGSLTAKLLGERCPMIDVEHIYLFNKLTLNKIFHQNHFEVIKVFDIKNTYPLWYYLRMLPLPGQIKNDLIQKITNSKLGKIRLSLNIGNIGIIARKI